MIMTSSSQIDSGKRGIEGKIPREDIFGNLFATIMLQFVSGTNKLYDPLNGLFGINVKVLNFINKKVYPKIWISILLFRVISNFIF